MGCFTSTAQGQEQATDVLPARPSHPAEDAPSTEPAKVDGSVAEPKEVVQAEIEKKVKACKMGCGREPAPRFDTCCKNCAQGRGHSAECDKRAAGPPPGCICAGCGVCPACRSLQPQRSGIWNDMDDDDMWRPQNPKATENDWTVDGVEVEAEDFDDGKCPCAKYFAQLHQQGSIYTNKCANLQLVCMRIPKRLVCGREGLHGRRMYYLDEDSWPRNYSDMKKMGTDEEEIRSRMCDDGVNKFDIHEFFGTTAGDTQEVMAKVGKLRDMGVRLFQIQAVPEELKPEEAEQFASMLKTGAPETIVRRAMARNGCTRFQIEQFFSEKEATINTHTLAALPPHWESQLLSSNPDVEHFFCLPKLSAGSSEFRALQTLLNDTYKQKSTRDRDEKLASRFELVQAYRAENNRMLRNYLARRELLAKECKDMGKDFVPIQNVKTATAGLPAAASLYQTELSEFYLFHGTTFSVGRAVCQDDFCIAFAAKTGMFGPGLYFAESISKSDEYVSDEVCNDCEQALCTILLCRVTMGRNYTDLQKQVDKDKLMAAYASEKYHSVLGDREKVAGTYREFIVYDESQAYAEYLLRYRRVY